MVVPLSRRFDTSIPKTMTHLYKKKVVETEKEKFVIVKARLACWLADILLFNATDLSGYHTVSSFPIVSQRHVISPLVTWSIVSKIKTEKLDTVVHRDRLDLTG